MKTISLIDILSEPTEQKPEKAPAFIDEVQAPSVERDIFAAPQSPTAPEPPKVEVPKIDTNHFAPEPPVATPKVEKPKLSYSENVNTATGVVALYDLLQTFLFPIGYKKAMFSKDEWKKVQSLIIDKKQNGETSISRDYLVLLEKHATFQELRDNVTFTDDESKAIIDPLAKVLGKYNIQLGPEMLLLSTLGMIALPRIMPFFSPLENRI